MAKRTTAAATKTKGKSPGIRGTRGKGKATTKATPASPTKTVRKTTAGGKGRGKKAKVEVRYSRKHPDHVIDEVRSRAALKAWATRRANAEEAEAETTTTKKRRAPRK